MNPEIEVEVVLYIDGEEVSTRRERVHSTNTRSRQDFWAVVDADIRDFRQIIDARTDQGAPF